mgnify:CR=1 FL=1
MLVQRLCTPRLQSENIPGVIDTTMSTGSKVTPTETQNAQQGLFPVSRKSEGSASTCTYFLLIEVSHCLFDLWSWQTLKTRNTDYCGKESKAGFGQKSCPVAHLRLKLHGRRLGFWLYGIAWHPPICFLYLLVPRFRQSISHYLEYGAMIIGCDWWTGKGTPAEREERAFGRASYSSRPPDISGIISPFIWLVEIKLYMWPLTMSKFRSSNSSSSSVGSYCCFHFVFLFGKRRVVKFMYYLGISPCFH